jgi:hypothetical protein
LARMLGRSCAALCSISIGNLQLLKQDALKPL